MYLVLLDLLQTCKSILYLLALAYDAAIHGYTTIATSHTQSDSTNSHIKGGEENAQKCVQLCSCNIVVLILGW